MASISLPFPPSWLQAVAIRVWVGRKAGSVGLSGAVVRLVVLAGIAVAIPALADVRAGVGGVGRIDHWRAYSSAATRESPTGFAYDGRFRAYDADALSRAAGPPSRALGATASLLAEDSSPRLARPDLVAAEGGLDAVAAARGGELQSLLPAGSAGRVTMGVGIGRDAAGGLRTVIGTSEANGYLRPAVRAAIQAGEEVAPGLGHAEQDILAYMLENEISPLTVGAGRPICPICAGEIRGAGASAATPLK